MSMCVRTCARTGRCVCQPVMVFWPDDCNATWIPEPDFSIVDHMSLQSLWYALTDRAARRGGLGENGPG